MTLVAITYVGNRPDRKQDTMSTAIADHTSLVKMIERSADHADYKGMKAQAIAGVRASLKRKLRLLEVDLYIEGVTFDPYIEPKKVAKRPDAFTPEQLISRVRDLRRVASSEKIPKPIRQTADQLLVKLTREADTRGITIAATNPPPATAAKTKRTRKVAAAAA